MDLSPYQLAREQRQLTLSLPLEEFPRLAALVAEDGGEVRVDVRFFRDDQNRCRMQGTLVSRQRMLCANCQVVDGFELAVEVDACLLSSEDAARELVGEIDPLVVEGVRVTPAELFEDDLLLGLPERPCLGRLDCPHRPSYAPRPVDEKPRENPFAVLAELKDDDRKQ